MQSYVYLLIKPAAILKHMDKISEDKQNWKILDCLIGISAVVLLLVAGVLIIKKIMVNPSADWDYARLAWTFALTHGYRLYYGLDNGPILCTTYGPLGPLAFLPATLAKTPVPALFIGTSLSIAYYFLPVLWLHIKGSLSDLKRLLPSLFCFGFFCLFTVASPALRYSGLRVHVDAPALGLCVIACAFLYFKKAGDGRRALMWCALFSVLSVWTKQVAIFLLPALSVYILIRDGYNDFKRYLFYLLVFGIPISILFLFMFGPKEIMLNLFIVQSRIGTLQGLPITLLELAPDWVLFAPILIIYTFYRYSASDKKDGFKKLLSEDRWIMLLLVSFFMAPISIFGRMKAGGDYNAFSYTLYFLVAAFTLALKGILLDEASPGLQLSRSYIKSLVILLVIILTCGEFSELYKISTLPFKRSVDRCETAYKYLKNHPGEAYFPNYPLAHLLAEGKLYHFSVGLWDRATAGYPITEKHFKDYIPPDPKYMVEPGEFGSDVVKKYLREFSQQVKVDGLAGCITYSRKK